MHQFQHVGRRTRRSAPVVSDAAVCEMRVDVTRVDDALVADEGEQGGGPLVGGVRRQAAARMHQTMQAPGDKPVVSEEVFFDRQARVLPFEIAGAIALHSRPQCQVLRSSGRPDGIGLHESQRLDRPRERGRREQAARNSELPEVVERCHERANCIDARLNSPWVSGKLAASSPLKNGRVVSADQGRAPRVERRLL